MFRKVSSLFLLCLAVVSAVPVSAQHQQQQLALAAASQQQGQQFQQPQFYAPAPAHGQFGGQRATLAGYQGIPVGYQGVPAGPAPRPLQPQVAYQQIPQPNARKGPRPINPNAPQQPLQEAEDYDPNPAYNFSFDVKDDTFTNYQNRKEQREGDKITGSYSVVDSDGFIRTVTYTADPLNGFKAEVVREPTDIVVKLPTPTPQAASLGGLQGGAYAPQPAPQQRQPQYLGIPSGAPAPSLRQHQGQPQYLGQPGPQQQQQALALARQAQLQQAQLLQSAYRPSSGKAALGGAPRAGVAVAGGLIYPQQQQLQQAAYHQ